MTAAPPTSELAAFIEARLSEDEAAANDLVALWDESPPSVYDMAQVESLEAGDPARVLAQVAALRAVVERYGYLAEHGDFGDGHWVLRHLAAIWADHDGWQEAWRG